MTVPVAAREAKHVGARSTAGALIARIRHRPAVVILARAAWITACTMLAFAASAQVTLDAAEGGDLTGYSILMPLLGITAAIGIARRRGDELPIHDRQIDSIVGGMVLVLALSTQWLLAPRYSEQYLLLRIDTLAALMFILGAAILMFGLRPAGRFWPVWLLMFGVPPLIYRIASVGLGGLWQYKALLMAVLTAVAIAIAVGRNRRRALIGFVATLAVGVAALVAIYVSDPSWPTTLLQLTPSIAGGVVVSSGMYARTGYVFSEQGLPHQVLLDRPVATTKGMWRASAVVLAVAIGINLLTMTPVPVTSAASLPQGPTEMRPTAVPAGWAQVDERDFAWVIRFFGENSNLTRQQISALDAKPEWDELARPRTIMVDTLNTDYPARLSVYPADTLYPTSRARVSPRIPIELGHGLIGELHTIVDEDALLTWTKLSFEWTRGAHFQRINMITVDNHLPTATFPEPTPSMASNIPNTFNVLLRGNAVTENDQPEYKDAAMLTVAGQALVDAQMETS